MMERRWRVVIPSDNEENLAASSESILSKHKDLDPSAVLVVSRKLMPKTVRESLRRLTFVQDSGDFNFARSVNLGFLAAGGKDVVIMGDDVELITDGGFDFLQEEAAFRILSASVIGRVGPSWQRGAQEHLEVPFVSFVCVYIPETVWKIVGRLDEGFPGYGYEDTDFCLRARRRGLSCGVNGRVVVEHGVRLASSFVSIYKDNLTSMELAARNAFEDKWRSRLV